MVELIDHEVGEPPAGLPGLDRVGGRTARPAVAPPILVQAQPLRHNHEPGGELAATVAGPAPEAPAVVGTKPFENVGVAVHHGVVIAAEGAGHVQQQAAVALQKSGPGIVPTLGIRSVQKAGQFWWDEVGHPPLLYRTAARAAIRKARLVSVMSGFWCLAGCAAPDRAP